MPIAKAAVATTLNRLVLRRR